jgi:hypothetical protein
MAFSLAQLLSPPVVDADPNAVAPTADRVLQIPTRDGFSLDQPFQLGFMLADGESVDFVVWFRVDELVNWTRLDNKTVLARHLEVIGNVIPDTQVFTQVTSLLGAPTKLGIAII